MTFADGQDQWQNGRPAAAGFDAGHEHFWLPELHRRRGLLIRASGRGTVAEAEACFANALAAAREREMRSLELRAAMSLAELWSGRGERARAHDLLVPIYGWFTEGFDTPDLIEAKELLDELSASGS